MMVEATRGGWDGIVDKHGRLGAVHGAGPVRLEFGCGDRRQLPGAITIDQSDCDAVDVVGDVFAVLAVLPDASVDEIYSSHFVEHLDDFGRFVREAARVLKVGGRMCAVAPHFSNPYFYSDPTHRVFFGLYTFSYYVEDRVFRRVVPRYQPCPGLSLVEARLVFKSAKAFPVQYAIRKLVELLVNSTRYTREFYEANLCYAVPCYEVRYDIVKGEVAG
jgi:ubiquinone/menaquinone biosynthesis C-methylase UbiE